MKSKRFFFKKWLLLFILSLIGIGGTFIYLDIYREKELAFDFHGAVDNEKALEGWVAFTPKENNFSAHFPKDPKEGSREFPIPGSHSSLSYREFSLLNEADDEHFSVSYAVLPDKWLKFGSRFVLKGGLKVVLRELGRVTLVGKSSNNFKNYPSLDYEHYLEDRETAGTLILVENTLYKIEMTYPLNKREEAQKRLIPFIQSFKPILSETKTMG